MLTIDKLSSQTRALFLDLPDPLVRFLPWVPAGVSPAEDSENRHFPASLGKHHSVLFLNVVRGPLREDFLRPAGDCSSLHVRLHGSLLRVAVAYADAAHLSRGHLVAADAARPETAHIRGEMLILSLLEAGLCTKASNHKPVTTRLVRRHLWMSPGGFSMSRRDSDSEKVPAALYDRLTDTPTYAARMYKAPLCPRSWPCRGN